MDRIARGLRFVFWGGIVLIVASVKVHLSAGSVGVAVESPFPLGGEPPVAIELGTLVTSVFIYFGLSLSVLGMAIIRQTSGINRNSCLDFAFLAVFLIGLSYAIGSLLLRLLVPSNLLFEHAAFVAFTESMVRIVWIGLFAFCMLKLVRQAQLGRPVEGNWLIIFVFITVAAILLLLVSFDAKIMGFGTLHWGLGYGVSAWLIAIFYLGAIRSTCRRIEDSVEA